MRLTTLLVTVPYKDTAVQIRNSIYLYFLFLHRKKNSRPACLYFAAATLRITNSQLNSPSSRKINYHSVF